MSVGVTDDITRGVEFLTWEHVVNDMGLLTGRVAIWMNHSERMNNSMMRLKLNPTYFRYVASYIMEVGHVE